jgi:hypothetical protein
MYGGQAHHAMRDTLLPDALDREVDVPIGRPRRLIQQPARFREFHAAPGAHEQWPPDTRFQRRQLLAESGLRLVQLVRGF